MTAINLDTQIVATSYDQLNRLHELVNASGSSVISVTAKNGGGNRGTFVVEVAGSPACGTAAKLTVQVNSN